MKVLYANAGRGVDIYILDTGIRYSHQVFGGRASFGGYDEFGGQGVDDHGHGTHCAGLAAGRLTGVAWGARVYRYVCIYHNYLKPKQWIRGLGIQHQLLPVLCRILHTPQHLYILYL